MRESLAVCAALLLAACNDSSPGTRIGDASSASASASANGMSIAGAVPTRAPAGQAFNAQISATATMGRIVGYNIVNKPSWASFNTASGALQGRPGLADIGSYHDIVVSASDGNSSVSLPPISITVTPTPAASRTPSSDGSTARPAYNTGNGFFVANGKLYDPNGHEFRIRGVNRLHWDSASAGGIAASGANTVRWDMDFTRDAAANVSEIQSQGIASRSVPIVGNWTATCSSDPSQLDAAVQSWTAQAPQWTQLNQYLIVNVANEWGPSDSTVWRDSYRSAITSLRNAGYTGPILVDSGGCGQDDQDLLQYSQAVFNSDREHNVIFAVHLYGSTNDYSAQIASVQKGNPTVVTLASSSPTHPFAPGYNGSGNNWSGISAYHFSGVEGMMQLNGAQPARTNVGGAPGAWTITLAVDSSNWPDYTGGGSVVDSNGNYALRLARLAALSQATGAVYIVGEFGPGGNIGPSPTTVTPAEIITAAEANGIGWLAWAWDDLNLPNCEADNNWFSMTYHCGAYTQLSDLTRFGQDVVLNPTYGLRAVATQASIFD